jgi:hypothetical protein
LAAGGASGCASGAVLQATSVRPIINATINLRALFIISSKTKFIVLRPFPTA